MGFGQNVAIAHLDQNRIASTTGVLPCLPVNAVCHDAGLISVALAWAVRHLIVRNIAMNAGVAVVS